MARIAVTVGTVCVVAATLSAQQPNPKFEVASVKRNRSGDSGSSGRMAKDWVTILNQTARLLIVNAYGLRPDRILGGPSWLNTERFDVSARAPANTPDSRLPLMLRTLLSERFKLVARRETRDQSVFALVRARSDGRLGPKLRPAGDCLKITPPPGDGRFPELQPNQPIPCGTRMSVSGQRRVLQGGSRPIADLMRMLRDTGASDREVIDRTGLTANFDFDLRYAPNTLRGAAPDAETLPNLSTALEEQLGLKLESARGQVEYLVIDSIERPTPD